MELGMEEKMELRVELRMELGMELGMEKMEEKMELRMELRMEHRHSRVSCTPRAPRSSSGLPRFILQSDVAPARASAPRPLLDHYFHSLGERLSPANTSRRTNPAKGPPEHPSPLGAGGTPRPHLGAQKASN